MLSFTPPGQPERVAQWLTLILVCAFIIALSLDFIFTMAEKLRDRWFFSLIAMLIAYPALAIAGTILHLKLRRAPTLMFAVGSWGSLVGFALTVFGGITTGVLSPLSFLVGAVGLLWLAFDLKSTRKRSKELCSRESRNSQT